MQHTASQSNNARPATTGQVRKITKIGTGKYFVETNTFLSDGTYQSGLCDLDGRRLRFPGAMNRLPFRVVLSPVSYTQLLDLRHGEFIAFTLIN